MTLPPFDPIQAVFATLPDDDLGAAIRYLKSLIATLEHRRERIRTEDRARHLDRLARDLPANVARAIADGMDPTAAVAAVARNTGMPPATVTYWWTRSEKERAARERAARDIEIVRLARRGWSNAGIADRFGISPRTVSGIVRKAIDGRHGHPEMAQARKVP